MKNIHVLPTDKPSRIYLIKSNNKLGITSNNPEFTENFGSGTQNQHIYITSDEEIKEGDWMYYKHFGEDIVCKYDTMNGQNTNVNEHKPFYQKIILTTDQDLDGVQAIDDEFLEWFVKNPSCESIEVESGLFFYAEGEDRRYKIIIPQEEAKQRAKNYMSLKGALEPKQIKCYCGHTSYCDCSPLEEPKQETLEEAAEKYARKQCDDMYDNQGLTGASWGWETSLDFIAGAKWQQERMYSEEDMEKAFQNGLNRSFNSDFDRWFKQFKKK